MCASEHTACQRLCTFQGDLKPPMQAHNNHSQRLACVGPAGARSKQEGKQEGNNESTPTRWLCSQNGCPHVTHQSFHLDIGRSRGKEQVYKV